MRMPRPRADRLLSTLLHPQQAKRCKSLHIQQAGLFRSRILPLTVLMAMAILLPKSGNSSLASDTLKHQMVLQLQCQLGSSASAPKRTRNPRV